MPWAAAISTVSYLLAGNTTEREERERTAGSVHPEGGQLTRAALILSGSRSDWQEWHSLTFILVERIEEGSEA